MTKLLSAGLIATALLLTLAGPSSAQDVVRMAASLTGGEETPGLLTAHWAPRRLRLTRHAGR